MGPMRGQSILPGRQVRVPGDPKFLGYGQAGRGLSLGGETGEGWPHISFQRNPGPFQSERASSLSSSSLCSFLLTSPPLSTLPSSWAGKGHRLSHPPSNFFLPPWKVKHMFFLIFKMNQAQNTWKPNTEKCGRSAQSTPNCPVHVPRDDTVCCISPDIFTHLSTHKHACLKILLCLFRLCCALVAVHMCDLRLLSSCGVRASPCCGSCRQAWAPGPRASVVAVHQLRCPVVARGICLDQGLKLCPLRWQADSQPLCHQGSPRYTC